jgi:hypothetical protein
MTLSHFCLSKGHPYLDLTGVSHADFVEHYVKLIGSFVELDFKSCENCECYRIEEQEINVRFVTNRTFSREDAPVNRTDGKEPEFWIKFKLNDLEESDKGKYLCQDYNGFGQYYFSFDLHVKG